MIQIIKCKEVNDECVKLGDNNIVLWKKPYMLFNLTYGCFSLLIEVPRNNDNSSNTEFEKVPFPPIPFHISGEGFWNLSSDSLPQGTKHSMILEFGAIADIANRVESINKKGKRHINIKSEVSE